MKQESQINIHAIIPRSRVNGPGRRMVVFFQGCGRKCAGCFNPETHSFEKRLLFTPQKIFDKHMEKDVEGITVSGGEPFAQPEGLAELLRLARTRYGLGTVVYTGFTVEELRQRPSCLEPLEYIDVLIDGAYEGDKRETTLLARGSTNQRLIFFKGSYALADFYMPGRVEVIISAEGVVTETGFSACAQPGF